MPPSETLRILERISDHADNLAVSVARSLAEQHTGKTARRRAQA